MRAKRAKEVRALKKSYRREVAALEQKLQIAAGKPRKKGKRDRACSPSTCD